MVQYSMNTEIISVITSTKIIKRARQFPVMNRFHSPYPAFWDTYRPQLPITQETRLTPEITQVCSKRDPRPLQRSWRLGQFTLLCPVWSTSAGIRSLPCGMECTHNTAPLFYNSGYAIPVFPAWLVILRCGCCGYRSAGPANHTLHAARIVGFLEKLAAFPRLALCAPGVRTTVTELAQPPRNLRKGKTIGNPHHVGELRLPGLLHRGKHLDQDVNCTANVVRSCVHSQQTITDTGRSPLMPG